MPEACTEQSGNMPKLDNQEQFIVKCIQDDLLNIYLVVNREQQGLAAENQYLSLSVQVFKLLKIQDRMDLYEVYFELALQVMEMEISNKEKLEKLALEIYLRMKREAE
jgi:hypothetical protein